MTQADDAHLDDGLEPEQAEVEAEQTDNLEADTEPSESSPEQGETPQKVEFTPEQQAVIDKAIGEKVFKQREAERKAEQIEREYQEKLKALQSKLPQEQRPSVPQYPDRYDFDSDAEFQRAVQERDEAVQRAAEWDGRQQAIVEQQEAEKIRRQQEQTKALADKAQSYTQKAKTLGISPEQLRQSGDRVAQFGVSEDIAQAILGDDLGPLITTYLANNVNALDSLARSNPMQAGMLLAQIKTEAAKLKPRLPSAPKPSEPIQGGAAPRQRGPKGATFT